MIYNIILMCKHIIFGSSFVKKKIQGIYLYIISNNILFCILFYLFSRLVVSVIIFILNETYNYQRISKIYLKQFNKII